MLVYPAIFYKAKDSGYFVDFVDFEGYTGGATLEEAMYMAVDILGIKMSECFISSESYPKSTSIKKVELTYDEDAIMDESFVTLVSVDVKEYIKRAKKKTVRKNISIPSYLNEMAKNNNINVSKFLKEALEKEFEIE